MMKRRIIFTGVLVFCLLCGFGVLSAQGPETGRISGQLIIKNRVTMEGGLVYFTSKAGPVPDPAKFWRIPDFLGEIKEGGRFSVELPEGEYYVGAIKRKRGKTKNGPPEPGDYFYRALDENGGPRVYAVKKGENLDLGTVSGMPQFKGLGRGANISAVEGRILDVSGKPVKGAYVFAFLSQSMIGRPVFASYKTGRDGKYQLRVHAGGNYYLRVRDVYGGGPPVVGALIGNFGGETPEAVTVKTGEITGGIDITVVKFQGRGQR